MTLIDRYREWYEQEIDSNDKMLAMIESVPGDRRSDPRFQRAIVLAAHLSACRDNWLDRMIHGGKAQTDWWPEDAKLEDLRTCYAVTEQAWSNYFAKLNDGELTRVFEFLTTEGKRFRLGVEAQIMQLIGHAFYHRGQIALLVDQLGGQPVDTDFLYWAYSRNPTWGLVSNQ
jgi:uncharacterized damage-inducible protein DinB